jgi:vitamin B12 transporter
MGSYPGFPSRDGNCAVSFLKEISMPIFQPIRGFVSSCDPFFSLAQSRKAAKRALLITAALLPSTAFAQADEADEPIVVTATGAPQAVSEVSAAISTVLRVKYPLPAQPQVADILATVPGVNVTRNGGTGGLSAVRIRGAEGDQTLVLIDGVRVNDPASTGGAFDFGQLLMGNIQRVEIFRGPNSVPWGSQAIGGVINVIQEEAGSSGLQAKARAEYGSNDARQLSGNVSGSAGIIGYSLGGGWFAEDGISAFKGGTEKDGFRQYAANGRVKVNVSDSIDLDVRGYYVDGRTEIDGFPPPIYSFADTPEYSTYQQAIGYAGGNVRLFDDRLKSRLAYTISDINRDNFDAPGQATPSFLARGRTERFEYQGDAEFTKGLRGIFGIERELTRFSDGFDAFETAVTSGYAQLVAEPVEQVTLTGGVRIDDHRAYGTQTTVGANLVWRPAEGTKLSASYGEGFKAPSLFQLNSFFGNVSLQPEQAKNYEIGIEQQLFNRDLTATINLFQRNTSSQIDFISCFGQNSGICTNRPFGTYDNIDRTRTKGLEFIVFGRPASGLTLEANYSLIDAKDRSNGLSLVRRPKHNANASVDWEMSDWLRIGGTIQWHSKAADIDFETFSRTQLRSYALVGLRAVVPVGGQFEFYGRVENLFDAQYETVSGYGTYGRNAHVGVRARF